jgi:hypothetical protein
MRAEAKHRRDGIKMRNATALDITESIIGLKESGLLL